MRTMSRDEVAEVARPLVDFVGDVLGPEHIPTWRGIVGAPCTLPDGSLDPDVYAYTIGAQVMDVPVDEHIGLLRRLHDAVVERRWNVGSFSVHEDTGTASLVCVHPRTGYELAVSSTKPPTALAVLVNTPAIAVPPGGQPYDPASGRDPSAPQAVGAAATPTDAPDVDRAADPGKANGSAPGTSGGSIRDILG